MSTLADAAERQPCHMPGVFLDVQIHLRVFGMVVSKPHVPTMSCFPQVVKSALSTKSESAEPHTALYHQSTKHFLSLDNRHLNSESNYPNKQPTYFASLALPAALWTLRLELYVVHHVTGGQHRLVVAEVCTIRIHCGHAPLSSFSSHFFQADLAGLFFWLSGLYHTYNEGPGEVGVQSSPTVHFRPQLQS